MTASDTSGWFYLEGATADQIHPIVRSNTVIAQFGAEGAPGQEGLRREASALKECVADLTLENRLLKKSIIADGEGDE